MRIDPVRLRKWRWKRDATRALRAELRGRERLRRRQADEDRALLIRRGGRFLVLEVDGDDG